MAPVTLCYVSRHYARLRLIALSLPSHEGSSPTSDQGLTMFRRVLVTRRGLAPFRDGAAPLELNRYLVEHGIKWHVLPEREGYARSLTAWCYVVAFRPKSVEHFPRGDRMALLNCHDDVDLLRRS